jgi:Bacterial extracellular solute-binding proteins, family 5 Middle
VGTATCPTCPSQEKRADDGRPIMASRRRSRPQRCPTARRHRDHQPLGFGHPTLLRSDPQPLTDIEEFNTRLPPFNNVLARRAVNYATDRNELVRRTGGPELTTPTCQLLPPNFPAHHDYCPFGILDSAGHYAGPNLTTAQQLITQSGTRGERVTVDVNAFDQKWAQSWLERADRIRGAGRAACRPWPDQPPDRRATLPIPAHRLLPPPPHLHQTSDLLPHRTRQNGRPARTGRT